MHQRLNLPVTTRPSRTLWAGGLILLLAALLLGGATREGHLVQAAVRLLSLPVMILALWRLSQTWTEAAKWPVLLLAAVLAVPLVQLIPLPPGAWTALPGRADFAAAYQAAGIPVPWQPISLDRDATWNAALSLLPPAAMFLATLGLDPDERRSFVPWVLGVVMVSIVLGVSQVADGDQSVLRFYEITNATAAVGFFSNRNHQASLLVAALPLAALWTLGWARRGERGSLPVVVLGVGLILIAGVGVWVSESRAGALLLVPAGLGCLALAVRAGLVRVRVSRRALLAVLAVVVLVALPLAAFRAWPMLQSLSASLAADPRLTSAPTVARAVFDYLPLGTGLGTFEPIFRSLETPEMVTNAFLNHAHDDYLELLLETGLIGLALIVLFLVWFARAALRAWRRGGLADGGMAPAASVVIALLLLHSVVDYPLRTTALATLFAFACACLVPPRGPVERSLEAPARPHGRKRSRSPAPIQGAS